MKIWITTTGSYPPLPDKSVKESIKRAIEDQINAGVDLLVDGQVRSDIVGIFAREIGLQGDALPYRVPDKLGKPTNSTTLEDLKTAAGFADGRPLKAHLTGPTVIAESCLEEGAHERYQGENGFRNLVVDIAEALAEEARMIANEADTLNVQYLQIDEPSLVYGADLSLAREGVARVVEAWKTAGGGLVILHVCGDSASIWDNLLQLPVDILNLESETLRTLDEQQARKLAASRKQLALGVVPVDVEWVPSPQRIARDSLFTMERFGEEALWGLTPVCGMRLSGREKARQRMEHLRKAADILGRQARGQEE